MLKLIFILYFVFSFGDAGQEPEGSMTNIIWEDQFTASEKEKLTIWLQRISSAVFETLGEYPFEVNLYLHRNENKNEPVPWAHTVRDDEEGVHFYVCADYSLGDFMNDWTAPHEISHLSIPYLGKKNLWFSEGYASYMQYRVMLQADVLTADEMTDRYISKLQNISPVYDSDERFLALSGQLRSQHNYPAVYWGGACLFMQADSMLKSERNMSLPEIIKQYQSRGRSTDDNLDDLIASLDEVSQSTIFSDLVNKFQNETAREAVLNTPVPEIIITTEKD